jgi:very-short-patch-repair endonuclease
MRRPKISHIKKLNKALYLDLTKYAKRYKREMIFGVPHKRDENTKQTKPEMIISAILKREGIYFTREYCVLGKYYDFFLSDYNILLEMDGTYFHGKQKEGLTETTLNTMQIKNRCNDIVKNAIAKGRGFKLVRIWEDELYGDVLMNRIDQARKEIAEGNLNVIKG